LFKILLLGKLFLELNEVKYKMNMAAQNLHKFPLAKEGENLKISVVIPTLNESSYIKKPILSLKANSYRNFEIIIVDGMSNDDTAIIAKNLGSKVIISGRRKIGYDTHLGFISAEGDIIVRTDADSIFPRDILIKIVRTFENPQIMVYHIGHLYYDGNILLNLLAHLYDKYWRRIWATSGHFIAVRKTAYEKLQFKPLARGEDFDFGKRAYEIFGQKAFVYDPDTVILISSRAISKHGLLRYIFRGGSFRA